MSGWDLCEQQAEEVSKKGGKYLKLEDDGDSFAGVFADEPISRSQCFVDGKVIDSVEPVNGVKPTFGVFVNVYLPAENDVKIFRMSKTMFGAVLACRKKYSDFANTVFEVRRIGKKGDQKTSYSILFDRTLTANEKAALAQVQLWDLKTDERVGSSPTPASQTAPAAKTTPSKPASGRTVEQLREHVMQKSYPKEKVISVLKDLGCTKLSDVPADKIDQAFEFFGFVDEELAAEKKASEEASKLGKMASDDPFA